MRLLLIEEERQRAQTVRTGLAQLGWAVDWSPTAAQGENAASACSYDGIVMQLDQPDGGGGQALLKRLRKSGFRGPLIVLCADATAHDCAQLLDLGADDCLARSLDLQELAARLRAVARRGGLQAGPVAELQLGALHLQLSTRTVNWNGQPVAVTNKEFWLLETLLRRKNQIVSRTQLEQTLYGWDDDVDSNTVEVYVHHLRRKFGAELIQTVRGSGYCIGQLA